MTATIETAKETVHRSPVERAWADLCDCKDNPDVERVMASIGGWGAWAEVELPYLAFVGAFNGEPEHAARILARAAAKAGAA
jgi:muramoyltetrapeptide carboxypeptidase LdcA involved in peptidoglycan recycling